MHDDILALEQARDKGGVAHVAAHDVHGGARFRIDVVEPAGGVASAVTSAPAATSASATCEPMKPSAPVTTTFLPL
jgi:hypothetical protein